MKIHDLLMATQRIIGFFPAILLRGETLSLLDREEDEGNFEV
jgi:hypothetical protein